MFKIFPEGATIEPGVRVKFGIDPTYHRLHLGHMVPLKFVRGLAAKGHPVTIVLGTFTARLGDPSGRDATRPILDRDTVEANAAAITKTINKFMPGWPNMSGSGIAWNGNFLYGLPLSTFMELASNFTVTHMMSRDSFQRRQEAGTGVALHELLVPICQGYDSVCLQAGVEVGGQDQLFNFQIARQMQEIYHQKPPQVCVMAPIIRGTDGRKMSKSLDNCVWMDEEPNDMFGKVMSVSDEVMEEWLPLLLDDDPSTVDATRGPMHKKKVLAYQIVMQCHGNEAAQDAWRHFEKTVQNRETPEVVAEVEAATLVEAVVKIRDTSRTEARRLLGASAVRVDGAVVKDDVVVRPGQLIKVGKLDYGMVRSPQGESP
jgi:tyrosyl-tRNA synthetase